MTDNRHDWQPLWGIFCSLNSGTHPLKFALTLPGSLEGAIANAVRSGEVPVRGCRSGGYSSLALEGAFERIEGKLNTDANVNVFGNEITVREKTYVGKPFGHVIMATKLTVALETYGCVEVDRRALEKWLRENALPRWWQGALAEDAPTCDLIGVNKRKRTAVLNAIASLGCENLSKMRQKEREARIIAVVEREYDGLRVTDRYVRELYSETLRNVPN